jgi:hypothetical protein
MKGKHNSHIKGKNHYRWNGDLKTSNGYILIRVGKNHPLSDSNGYCKEHLLVWAACNMFRLPNSDEVLHHRNGDKTDNRIENLELMNKQCHERIHGRLKLTDMNVKEIRERYANGDLQKDLAVMFSVNPQTISKIVRGFKRKTARGPISEQDNRIRGGDGKYIGKKSAGRELDGRTWGQMPGLKKV